MAGGEVERQGRLVGVTRPYVAVVITERDRCDKKDRQVWTFKREGLPVSRHTDEHHALFGIR